MATTPQQEMLLTLVDIETLKKASQVKGKTAMPLEKYNMSFLLRSHIPDVINLELISIYSHQTKSGKESTVTFSKPIGFYKKLNGGSGLEIYALNEYYLEFEKLKQSGTFNHISIKNLSLSQNALIAAFAIETLLYVTEIFENYNPSGERTKFDSDLGIHVPTFVGHDKNITINGLAADLLMSYEGTSQFFLDDKYGISSPFAHYINQNGNINCSFPKELVQEINSLKSMNLLTMFE